MTDLTVSVTQITPLLERLLTGHGPDDAAPLVLIRGELEDGAGPTVTISGQPVDLVASASPSGDPGRRGGRPRPAPCRRHPL